MGRSGSTAGGDSAFVWQDQGCFVELHPVETGYLVLWGRSEDRGRRTVLEGNRVYPTLADARRRVADAVLELTRRPDLAAGALERFDHFPFAPHRVAALPEPL